MNGNSQRGFVVFALLFVVLLVGAGFYYYGKGNFKLPVVTQRSSSNLEIPATPSPVADEIVGWKTYTDTSLGFSLKYPEGWIVDPAGAPSKSTRLNNNDTNWGKIAAEQNKKTYQVIDDSFGVEIVRSSDLNYISDIGENRLIKSEATVVDGIIGKKQYFRNGSEPRLGTGVAVKVTSGKYTYSIAGVLADQTQEYLNSQYAKIFDQILSTFKFTNR